MTIRSYTVLTENGDPDWGKKDTFKRTQEREQTDAGTAGKLFESGSDIDYKTGKWNKKSECYTDRKALQLIWVYGGLSAWQGGCVSSTEFCV